MFLKRIVKIIRYRIETNLTRLILVLIKIAKIDLIAFAYENRGIGKSYGFKASGEEFLVAKVLKNFIPAATKPVFFDVGSNIGSYSKLLAQHFPKAAIYSFEPNPNTYRVFCKDLPANVIVNNMALGEEVKSQKIYTLKDNLTSVRSSVDPIILSIMADTQDIISYDVNADTLDNYCAKNKIERIDLLKIDAEGSEIEILKGAHFLLNESKIGILQFEFNEVNVTKRIFIKDFFDLLSNKYQLYRLDTNKLIPLGNYNYIHEIFLFQNIVAIHRNFNQTNLHCSV